MTARRYLLGVDLGTTGTKAALYSKDGNLFSEGRANVPIRYPQPGQAEQDLDEIYQSAVIAVRNCLAACSADSRDIAGIAFDSQMAGVGAIDENFRPAMRFDSWLDMRCQPYIDELKQRHAEPITRLTGCPPTCDHGPKMLWWMHERPTEYQRVARWVVPASYVAGRMAGLRAEEAFLDYTFLHFTALSEAETGTWSPELCGLLGVDASRLPRIVAPWDMVGEIQPEAAAEFGLSSGIPIAAGCGDTAAGALGAGVVNPGMLLDTAGTASVFACCTDQYVADVEHLALMTMRSVVPGVWNPLAYVGGGGLALPWFREQFAGRNGSQESYDAAFETAAQAPAGCDGLLFSPHLSGRICPASPEMRGAWIGFSFGHSQPHFLRSILEGVAYEYKYYLRVLEKLLPAFRLTEARVIGGGAKSVVWNQIKADILQVPYRRILRDESATWGAALVAGKAAGVIGNLVEAATCSVPAGDYLEPDRDLGDCYEAASLRYFRWQEELQKGFKNYG